MYLLCKILPYFHLLLSTDQYLICVSIYQVNILDKLLRIMLKLFQRNYN